VKTSRIALRGSVIFFILRSIPMRRISAALAAAGLAVTVLAATSPAQADPSHLIRWSDTGFCQIWDEGIPTTPWPGVYAVISITVPTFRDALDVKYHMLQAGNCSF
jgi:hypothetical protein